MESILISIKKLLGIDQNDLHFDPDIVMGINTALMILNQIGVGPTTCFSIFDDTKTWKDFLGDRGDLEAVKTYVHLKVRLMFDPPSNDFLVKAIERQIEQLEWRLNIQAQPPITIVDEGGV